MARKKKFNTKYSPEFKISVILDMQEHKLGYKETMRKYFPDLEQKNYCFLKKWERIFFEEGETGFYVERRGRQPKMKNTKNGRPRKIPLTKEVEQDLIAENQRLKEQLEYLQMENDYLKKLNALVREEKQRKNKRQ